MQKLSKKDHFAHAVYQYSNKNKFASPCKEFVEKTNITYIIPKAKNMIMFCNIKLCRRKIAKTKKSDM